MMFKKNFLNENSEFAWTILSCIGDGIISADTKGRITYINSTAESITGWSAEEALGEDFTRVFVVFDTCTGKTVKSPVKAALDAGGAIGLKSNSAIRTRDGEIKYISANCSPVSNPEGYCGVVIVFRDISRLRAQEIQTIKSKEFYQEMFDNFPALVWNSSLDNEVNFFNKSWLEFTGKKQEEQTGFEWVSVIHPGDADACVRDFIEKSNSRQSFELEYRLRRHDGEYRNMLELARPYYDPNGNFSGYVGVVHDITEQKEHEKTLGKIGDFYLSILESFPGLIWRGNAEIGCTYMDRRWEEYTGLSFDEAQGLGWLKFVHQDDVKRVTDTLNNAFRDKKQFEMEFRIRNSDGHHLWVLNTGRPFYDISGNYDGFIGTAIDISARKQAEKSIKQSEEKFRSIFNTASDAIYLHEILEDDERISKIIEANDNACEVLGYTREEMNGLHIVDFNKRKDAEFFRESIKKIIINGDYRFENIYISKDGREIPVEINAHYIVLGEKKCILCIVRDITKRKQMEDQLKAAKEEAERASKTKSEFLANMSHEVRTPINGILGMINLTMLTGLSDEQKENLTAAKACADSLLRIINDILDFSKMEAGKLTIDNINFSIKEMVEGIIKHHSIRARDKGLELNYTFSSALPLYLKGDPNRIAQVLNNLINNAVKFTESGSVSLSVKNKGVKDKFYELEFNVTDTGPGVAEEDIPKLFKSFSQIDGSFTKTHKGSGLGLIISKQLVELMGGEIMIESEAGKGSRFSFNLRLQAGEKPIDNLIDSPVIARTRKSLQILLAEDDNVNQFVISRMLKEKGHCVDIADNGLEAVEMFDSKGYDAVLMDIQMPEMDGIEAAKRIREKEDPNMHTPIIAVTAYALKGDRERFMMLGMDDYVAKPVQMDELFYVIDRACAGRSRDNIEQNDRISISANGEITVQEENEAVSEEKWTEIVRELSGQIERLLVELESDNSVVLEPIAGRIKHHLKEINAEELRSTAFKIELALRRGNLDEANQYARQLVHQFNVYRNGFNNVKGGPGNENSNR